MTDYTIKSGDTLSAIAKANGTTVKNLMELNPQIKDANSIFANDKIKFSADEKQPSNLSIPAQDDKGGTKAAAKKGANVAAFVGGAWAGATAGASIGAAVGSVVPIVGTAAGAVVGGLLGSIGGWIAGDKISQKVLEQ